MHRDQSTDRIIGIIGGIGPESTVDYYRGIIQRYREHSGSNNFPNILINSINMSEMLLRIDAIDYNGICDLLLDSIERLKSAGASVIAISSNTVHAVYDRLASLSPLPIISIVEATCKEASDLGLRKVLLIGTQFTMQSQFYQTTFSNSSINIIVPKLEERELIQTIIFSELEEGIVSQESKKSILEICNKLITNEKCDGIILGCTELPLMFHANDFDIETLNTTSIHIEAIVKNLLCR